jgi:hypothetical protein
MSRSSGIIAVQDLLSHLRPTLHMGYAVCAVGQQPRSNHTGNTPPRGSRKPCEKQQLPAAPECTCVCGRSAAASSVALVALWSACHAEPSCLVTKENSTAPLQRRRCRRLLRVCRPRAACRMTGCGRPAEAAHEVRWLQMSMGNAEPCLWGFVRCVSADAYLMAG